MSLSANRIHFAGTCASVCFAVLDLGGILTTEGGSEIVSMARVDGDSSPTWMVNGRDGMRRQVKSHIARLAIRAILSRATFLIAVSIHGLHPPIYVAESSRAASPVRAAFEPAGVSTAAQDAFSMGRSTASPGLVYLSAMIC
jgi:hypothetical protein